MTQMHRASRRRFLTTLGLAGGSTLLLGGRPGAQTPAATGRLDVHQHFVSPDFLKFLTARTATTPVPGLAAWKGFSPPRAVELLDTHGIRTAMLSVTAPGVHFGDPMEARRLARELNEYAASRMVGDHKGRFGLFAVLPMPDVDGSLQEIAHALDTLQAQGVGLLTSYGNAWLGDAAFAPVLEELNRRRAVVYTHPTDALCCNGLIPGVPNQMLEYPTDTTRTIASLIVSEAATKFGNVRFIFSHAGGTITSLAGRLLGPTASPDAFARPAQPNSRLFHLRRFYYDTAGSANPVAMGALRAMVPTSQILFGTDAPFFDPAPQIAGLRAAGFTEQELRAVEGENLANAVPGSRF
jgi:predicted TIM-barrel fold metal-dependent hydrolase